MGDNEQQSKLQDEIATLERRLASAKTRLLPNNPNKEATAAKTSPERLIESNGPLTTTPHHYLLLLSDSALPLGSFAFSSGLESFLAHLQSQSATPGISKPTPSQRFSTFLTLSLKSYSTTTLPFALHTHRHPKDLPTNSDLLSASTICVVARRASIAQGRALLSIWERSFAPSLSPTSASRNAETIAILNSFSALLRSTNTYSNSNPGIEADASLPPAEAHLAPLFGTISQILHLTLQQTAYTFMLSHVKALLSAAVRASVFGPYQAQKILASEEVQEGIRGVVENVWDWKVEDAGQGVPVMDLWFGRHELLYSRIFNS